MCVWFEFSGRSGYEKKKVGKKFMIKNLVLDFCVIVYLDKFWGILLNLWRCRCFHLSLHAEQENLISHHEPIPRSIHTSDKTHCIGRSQHCHWGACTRRWGSASESKSMALLRTKASPLLTLELALCCCRYVSVGWNHLTLRLKEHKYYPRLKGK